MKFSIFLHREHRSKLSRFCTDLKCFFFLYSYKISKELSALIFSSKTCRSFFYLKISHIFFLKYFQYFHQAAPCALLSLLLQVSNYNIFLHMQKSKQQQQQRAKLSTVACCLKLFFNDLLTWEIYAKHYQHFLLH